MNHKHCHQEGVTIPAPVQQARVQPVLHPDAIQVHNIQGHWYGHRPNGLGNTGLTWYQPFATFPRMEPVIAVLEIEGPRLTALPHGDAAEDQRLLQDLLDKFQKFPKNPEPGTGPTALTLHLSDPTTIRQLLPPRSIAEKLAQTYAMTFNTVFRVIDWNNFDRKLAKLLAADDFELRIAQMEDADTLVSKLLLIIALGAITWSSNNTDLIPKDALKSWIAYGKDWLASKMTGGLKPNLNTTQIMCLLRIAQHLHFDNQAVDQATYIEHHGLSNVGIQIGLHREPDRNLAAEEKELRRYI
ncbi:hypothetical protein QBC35DRAFT_547568 [Podospora australis]|uniref:Transcription factor domain-containing protein n=1 Tax=Podospora australis TaxID=1536484 RepID=A0AAN6WIL3_9PEZI|nr:hypothetical protein QBC35DRAFT_547568 [Podospora australis]